MYATTNIGTVAISEKNLRQISAIGQVCQSIIGIIIQ